MQQLDTILEKLPDARQETNGSIIFECPICLTEGYANKKAKLFANGAIACSRFASTSSDASRAHCQPLREMLGLSGDKSAGFISSTILDGARQVTLEIERASKSTQYVTARNCTTVLYNAELRLTNPEDRATFVAAIPDRDADERATINHELVQMIDRYRRAQAAVADSGAPEDERQSAATRLVALTGNIQLIHDANGDGYAVLAIDGHKETWPLRSRGFKRWLQRRFYEQYEKAPGSQAVTDALGVIEGKALYDGPERKIFVRIGEANGKIYLDLADEQWRAVEIDAAGWRVVNIPPVEFRRAQGMLPLPAPEAGGSVEALRPFLNLDRGDLWTLMLGSLVMKLRPRGPYPVDVLTGNQGCGKTSRARFLRALIDPSLADTRSAPSEIRDLQIAASNEWLPVFDNLSRMPEWLSDGFCCLSTGGGMRTRALYSDSEEAIFSTMRPVILTSITEIVERQDLLDRAIIFNLPAIKQAQRKTEKELWADFERARPGILGALLDAVASALKNENGTTVENPSRMADFERWAVAAEEALGLASGAFLAAYRKNQGSANELAIEASPIADAIIALAESQQLWTGTAKELFDLLLTEKSEEEKRKLKEQGWPKAPNSLSAMLRRLAPNLLIQGINVEFNIRTDKRGSRKLRLSLVPDAPKDDPPLPGTDLQKDLAGSQDFIGKTSSEIVRSSDHTETKGLARNLSDDPPQVSDDHRPASDDLYWSSDDPSDDLLDQAAQYQPYQTKHFAGVSDDLTISDDHLQSHSCEGQLVSLDTETEAFDEKRGITPRNAKMIGLALSYDGTGQTSYTTDRQAWPLLLPEPEQIVVMHNAKFDLLKLQQAGLSLPTQWEDTMIASHLLDETGAHGLKPLAKEHLDIDDPTTFEEANRMRLLDPAIFDEYARNDARYTFRLWPKFQREMERQGLLAVYELEKDVVPAVMAMEDAGMKIDLARMSEMSAVVKAESNCIEAEIYEHAGCHFDLHSPQKVAAILFDKLGVPSRKETNSGQRSVDKEALEEVRGHHPAVDAILRYREIDKLASTFFSVLPKFADADGRIHPEFKQLGATSGRFSCANPNVQQIPSRSELGKKLRQMFIAHEGHVLVVADWSQMELRILAQYSQDPLLLEAYSTSHETDLHTLTASRMFGKPVEQVEKTQRSIAKMINFGIAYGITPVGLFNRLKPSGVDVSHEDCKQFIRDYFKTYAGVRKFLMKVEARAREKSYVRNWFGRRRRVSGQTAREVRQAQNFVIQATAADMAKTAMVKLHAALPRGARLIAMVHDEFIVECQTEQAEVVRDLMIEMMQALPDGFTVPMVVEAKIGTNWSECK